jgi:hypothetical protein
MKVFFVSYFTWESAYQQFINLTLLECFHRVVYSNHRKASRAVLVQNSPYLVGVGMQIVFV